MAYSRFYDSDIYIYSHVSGHIECQACFLNEPQDEYSLFSMSVYITNDEQLRAHLEEHARVGHNMPEDLLQDILADPDRYGKYTP
jgi:ADP-glucose pyrophosphorylase